MRRITKHKYRTYSIIYKIEQNNFNCIYLLLTLWTGESIQFAKTYRKKWHKLNYMFREDLITIL